ncbi:MAG: carboxypeptidase regulatory-like domain-containing protein [Elusimicrobiota bacterium]
MMKKNCEKGFTLIEIMVALVILTTVILVYIGTFGNISKALYSSKAKTLATNLAQEKINILKSLSYYKLLITVSPAYFTDFSPAIPYDTQYYPRETILEGGISFERMTYVQVVQEINGELQTFSPTTPEAGMKLITATVVWREGGSKKKIQIRSVAANPDTKRYNAVVNGNVKKAGTSTNIPDAAVSIVENATWMNMTDTSGNYAITLLNGNYTIMASAWGYFSQSIPLSIGPSQTTTINFELAPMSSGTVVGEVWLNDHIVISQVVASTETAGTNQEYVELFNPTTYTWQIAISSIPIIGLKYQVQDLPAPADIPINYISSAIQSKCYYLIANTVTVNACGITRTADAVFSSTTNAIKCREDDNIGCGGIGIYYISDNSWIDVVGWDWNSGAKTAPIFETDGKNEFSGFEKGEQLVRRSRPSEVIEGIGRCYDSNNNNIDFISPKPLIYPPKNSSNSEPVASGVPVEAFVTASDGLSAGTVARLVGSPPASKFELTSVATGTWIVIISTDDKCLEISNVTIIPNGLVGVPNSATTPVWEVAGCTCAFILSENMSQGYISGKVTAALGNVISPPIKVNAGFVTEYVNSAGYYFIKLGTGTYNVTANPENYNPNYITATKDNIEIRQGEIISGIDFSLSQGGKVTGLTTRDGVNPVPDIVFTAQDVDGWTRGESISETDGRFQIINLSTGVYYIQPILSSKESSVPSKSTVTITIGCSVFSSTFTITGTLGKIAGTVTSSGELIKTGVLLIASTQTIAGIPPALSIATLSGDPYFVSNSNENGTYSIEVIGNGSLSYKVYAYYPTFSGSNIVIISSSIANITVQPGQTTSGVDFPW